MNLLKEEVNKSSNNKDSENTFIAINNNNFNNSGSGSVVVHSEIDKNENNSTTHYHHHLNYGDNNLDDNLLMDDLLNSNDLLFNNDNNNDNNRLDLYDHDHGIQNSNSYDNSSSSSYHHNNFDYPNFIDGNDGHYHHHDDNNCGDLFPALKECVFDDDFDNFFLDTMNDENSSNHETIDIVNIDYNHHHHDNNDFYSNYGYNSVDLDFDVLANSSQALILDNTDMYNNHMVLSKPADFFDDTAAIYQQKLSIDDRSCNGSKSSRGKSNSMTKLNTKNHNDKQQQQQQQILLSGKRSFDDSIGEIVVVVYICDSNLICHVFKYVCIYVIVI